MSLPSEPSHKVLHEILPREGVNHRAKENLPVDSWTEICETRCARIFRVAWNNHNSSWSIHTHEYERPEPCLDGTREVVFQRIEQWAGSSQADRHHFFWLQGNAGEGKSAIASSISRWFDNQRGYLGATFFFSCRDDHRSDTTLLFSTIAVQLAKRHNIMNKYVCLAMDQRRNYGNYSPSDEFSLLLKQPLEAAARQAPFSVPIMIVLDGIDELWHEESFRRDIFVTINLLDQLPAFVKILIVTRPQHDLQTAFGSRGSRVKTWRLGDVPTAIVDNDIARYIGFRMVALGDEYRTLDQADWPNLQLINSLVKKSQGNFGWAAWAMDFMHSADGYPEQLLKEVLDRHHPAGTLDPSSMDIIYNKTLEEAYPHDCSTIDLLLFHDVVGAISTARQSITLHVLCTLLGFIDSQSAHVVSKLHTVITITRSDPEMAGIGRMIDPSFSAYLTSTRCPLRFFIDSSAHHTAFAVGCLLRIKECLQSSIYRENDALSSDNTSTDGLDAKESRGLPDDLRYACQFFAEHVSESSQSSETLYEPLKAFFYEDVRNWFHALCILGLLHRAGEYLGQIQIWINACIHCKISCHQTDVTLVPKSRRHLPRYIDSRHPTGYPGS